MKGEIICSLSGLIILQHLSVLLLRECIAHFPQQLKGFIPASEGTGCSRLLAANTQLQHSCQRTRSRPADTCSVLCDALQSAALNQPSFHPTPASTLEHTCCVQQNRQRGGVPRHTALPAQATLLGQTQLQAAFLCTAAP